MHLAPAPDQSALPAAKPRRRRFRIFRLLFILTGLFILALLLAMFIPGLEFQHRLTIGGNEILVAERFRMELYIETPKVDRFVFQVGPLHLFLLRDVPAASPAAVRGGLFDGHWRRRQWRLEYVGPDFFLAFGWKA